MLRVALFSAFLGGAAHAQAPAVTDLTPVRNALTAPRTTPVTIRFSQPLSNTAATQGALNVFSQQAGGRKTGTTTVSGNTLSFDPATDFKAGETVSATVTAAAQSTNGVAATPHVFQFTTATAPSAGIFSGGSDVALNALSSSAGSGLLSGDIDGDGDLDLVASDPVAGQLLVRLNNGNGTFTGTQEIAATSSIGTGTLGDIDNDGDLDLLTTSSNFIRTYVNDGRGSFTNGQALAMPYNVFDVKLGDLDGDGDLDLVAAQSGPTISVRLNNGQGVFSGTREISSIISVFAIDLADVDNDGDLDLIAAPGISSTGNTRIILNDGTGTFNVVRFASAGGWTGGLAVGDIDGDGDIDLAISSFVSPATIDILSNDGAGNFSRTQRLLNSNPSVFGDVDGDGDLDLLGSVTSYDINGYLRTESTVFLNNGTGTFSNNRQLGFINVQTPLLADLDGNGSLDFLVRDPRTQTVLVRLNQVTPLQVTSVPLLNATAAPRNTNVVLGFNEPLNNTPATRQALRVFSRQAGGLKTGTATIAGNVLTYNPTTDFKPGETVSATLLTDAQTLNGQALIRPYVFQFTTAATRSNGTFAGNAEVGVTGMPATVVVGDIDGDGDVDLLTGSSTNSPTQGVSIRLNNGAGEFSPSSTLVTPVPGVYTMALGDVDGDGDLDLMTAMYIVSQRATLHLNDGAGNFSLGQTIATGNGVTRVVLEDMDGDGDLDLVTANFVDGSVSVRLNNGAGVFGGGTNLIVGPTETVFASTIGDIDNDGDLDLVTNYGTRLNDGNGVFGSNQQPGLNLEGILGDIDGDGDLDLVGNNGIRLNNGSGSFGSIQQPGVAGSLLSDVDGDGDLDLMATTRGVNSTSIRLNNGSGIFSLVAQVIPGTVVSGGGISLMGAGSAFADIDGDGDLDLLTANSNRSTVSVRFNQDAAPAQYRLNAGGGAVTVTQGVFTADQYYSDSSAVLVSSAPIAGTTDDALYQTERYSTHGQLRYAVPVANGQYTVVLHFAELYWTQPGQRVFNISLEGRTVRTNYDIVAKVGPLTATTETYEVTVADGVLNLNLVVPYFSGGADQAKLSGLEILPVSPLYRLDAGGQVPLATSRGVFEPDQYFSTASAPASTTAAIAGTIDDALYQSERHSTLGQLRYAVPVSAGLYTVVLHFAETYWTQPGQRVFNIGLEGNTVRTNYDIVAKVGPNTATTETFTVQVTDGVLNLDLVVPYLSGGADQAMLSALEITPVTSGSRGALATGTSTARGAGLAEAQLNVYPNPTTSGRFTLTCLTSKKQTGTLTLVDHLGRTVHEQKVQLQAGVTQVPVQAAQARPGLYQVVLRTADGQRLSQKLVVQP